MMIMDVAQERIAAFERRFGSPHLDFACHAAVPLAVTPDLLYQLWGNFQGDRQGQPLNIPWVAVSDLILSGLCEEVGYELYEMKMDVRQALLARLRDDPRFGEGRLRQVVGLLLAYVRNDGQRDDLYLKDQEFKESQQWTAWAYFEPVKTVKALAAEFERAYRENPADLMRLVSLTEVLHQPIEEFDQLRIFARAMGHFCRKRFEDCRGEVIQLTVKNNQVHLGNGVKINVPPEFLMMRVYHYEIITLNEEGEIFQRQKGQNHGYLENTKVLNLEMVRISAGEFMMGSPENEAERDDDEGPQHLVSVPQFWMSCTAITQAQWQIVAQLPQVVRSLNADPARFKGKNNPVEQVSWEDCIEFCLRLSEATGKLYRLPSEAEWEYACRAGTTTPFHFGPTLSTEVANYDGNSTYGQGKTGEYREKTIPVGSLNAPNAWGLHDMHGNVYEWCLDDWHGSYERAPTDGKAWIDDDNHSQNTRGWLKGLLNNESTSRKLLRGGSWNNYPKHCRSAYRYYRTRGHRNNNLGFRVVAPRTP